MTRMVRTSPKTASDERHDDEDPGVPQEISLIFSLVAYGDHVLAEKLLSNHQGNFAEIARRILPRAMKFANHSKTTYIAKGFSFNILVRNQLIYLCMANEASGRRMPFLFLDKVVDHFQQRYGTNDHVDLDQISPIRMAKILDQSYQSFLPQKKSNSRLHY